MTRLQRLGLLAVLGVILVLQAAETEALAHTMAFQVPRASVLFMVALAGLGSLAWLWEGKDKGK